MRISHSLRHTLTAFAALAMLAGCSGGGSQMAAVPLGQIPGVANQSVQQVAQNRRLATVLWPDGATRSGYRVTAPSFFSPAAKGKPLIFVSDATNNVVDIYLQARKNKVIGQITGLTYVTGIATDTAGNLYVTTSPSSPQILVYAPPYTGAPKLILDDRDYYPNAVAISRLGVVGVANECSVPSCGEGTGSITFYAKNSTTPCATIVADPAKFSYLNWGAAFDDKGNFYFDGANASFSSVLGEVGGGCNAKRTRLLTTANTVNFAQGIQIDKSDRIALVDTSSALIDTYDQPKKGSLGSPVSTTPLTGSSDPVALAFLRSGVTLYVTDGTDDVANEYDYPTGGPAINTISVGGIAAGVAVTPPLVR